MGDTAGILYGDVVDAYQREDREALSTAGERFLESIRDVDRLLATRREFLLGKWLADAKRWATNEEEARLYEWNARNLITLWGPRDSMLHEYAQRQWSGLIGGFYLPRWERFVQRLHEALAAGKARAVPPRDPPPQLGQHGPAPGRGDGVREVAVRRRSGSLAPPISRTSRLRLRPVPPGILRGYNRPRSRRTPRHPAKRARAVVIQGA